MPPKRLFAMLPILMCMSATSGCAALSLFGSTHTHTHHHNSNCDEAEPRLESLESRISHLEETRVRPTPAPTFP